MNIHHLELFYYVARHGGIGEAVRNIPYGIQQPAVSGQILQLEDYLGLSLFRRRPFALTPAGEELYRFIEPFFSNVEAVGEKLRGGATQLVRVAASGIVLREHLPQILQNLRSRFPSLKLMLQEARQPQIEHALLQQEIDLGITVLESRKPADLKSETLIQLPLVLLAPRSRRVKTAAELWQQDRISETLICLPSNEPVCRLFQQGLSRWKLSWPVGIEVNSLELIETYVLAGLGIGLSVAVPGRRFPAGIRVLPLPDFPKVVVGALWRGRLTVITEALLAELRSRAKSLAEAEAEVEAKAKANTGSAPANPA